MIRGLPESGGDPIVPAMRTICFRVRLSGLVLLAPLLLLAAGCSSFNRDYQQALLKGVPRDGIEGPWVGSWLSDKNGHNGELRGIITKVEGDRYETRFKARFWKIFTFTSEAEFEMQPHNEGFEFFGTKQLGWLAGGEYLYEGRVNNEKFFSTYQNKWDKGTFQMERPAAKP